MAQWLHHPSQPSLRSPTFVDPPRLTPTLSELPLNQTTISHLDLPFLAINLLSNPPKPPSALDSHLWPSLTFLQYTTILSTSPSSLQPSSIKCGYSDSLQPLPGPCQSLPDFSPTLLDLHRHCANSFFSLFPFVSKRGNNDKVLSL